MQTRHERANNVVVDLRHTTRHKNGKTHTYWRLVRSVRRGRKVIQETVAHLGELDAQGRARAAALARGITGERATRSQRGLFEDDPVGAAVAVKLDRVRLERSRSFGAVWLGWTLWRALELDELCSALMPHGREAVAWAEVAAILVIGRLCEPSSELHVAERWYRTTALEDLLGVKSEEIYDERLYRALDRLLPHKEALEQHLVRRLGELFQLDYESAALRCDEHLFRRGGRPEYRPARLLTRSPSRLRAGQHRAGGHARGHAVGVSRTPQISPVV